MKRLVFILLLLPPLLLCSQANQDNKQDSLRKVADQYMKEQQYEKAANLYKELGEKIDSDYKEISIHKVIYVIHILLTNYNWPITSNRIICYH